MVYDTVLIETEYALALCTARFVADRNAVVRGSSPRGRICFLTRRCLLIGESESIVVGVSRSHVAIQQEP